MSTCSHPIALETLADYWAGDLDAAATDAVDEHVFSCAACARASARVATLTEKLRTLEPSFLSRARVEELRAKGRRIEESFVSSGGRIAVTFSTQDFLVHRLGGLELADVERVAVEVKSEETGEVLAASKDAPYDAASGEVLIACQRHFAAFPPNVVFEVSTVDRAGRTRVHRYVVEHHFV